MAFESYRPSDLQNLQSNMPTLRVCMQITSNILHRETRRVLEQQKKNEQKRVVSANRKLTEAGPFGVLAPIDKRRK